MDNLVKLERLKTLLSIAELELTSESFNKIVEIVISDPKNTVLHVDDLHGEQNSKEEKLV